MTEARRYGMRSLRFKLVLASVVVEIIMLTVLVWNSTRITGDAMQEIFQNHIKSLVSLMNVSLAAPLVQRDYATLNDRLGRIVSQDSLTYIEVHDELGTVVASRGEVPETVRLDVFFKTPGHVYDQTFDITLAGRVIGRAHYGINVSLLQATLTNLRNQGALVASAEIILTILLLATLGALLTRHLRAMAQAARALTGGDYTVRIPVAGRDEVADTGQAFNTMAEAMAHDLAERKRAEASLQESEERLRLALDAAHMGTFDWDVPNNQITWSRWHEELWGFKPGEFDGTYEAFSGRVHPDDLPRINARVARCIAEREPYVSQFRVVWPDGSTHWIAGRGEFTFDAGGVTDQPLRMRGAVVEITERKRAELELQESSQQLETLSRRLLIAQETERRHIARELHDEIGQLLTVIKLDLQTVLRQPGTSALAPALKEGMESVDRVVARVRDLSLDLRPSMLDDLGLIPTLRWYVQRQMSRFGVDIALKLPPSLPRLASEIETACFRIVQEALTNIARHASATHIVVTLATPDSSIALTVHDDGQGFDVTAVHHKTLVGGGVGLLGMKERAELAGGIFHLASGLGQGTTIEVHFPFSRPENKTPKETS